MRPTFTPRHPPSKAQLASATLLTAATLLVVGIWTQSAMGDRLLPHAFCISASEPLLLLHLVSDGLIAIAYLLIPWTMISVVRKRPDIPFGWVAWVFGAFIVACGATHAMEMWTLWYPMYWYSGVTKAFTAAVSLGTAWLLYTLTPEALALPSVSRLMQEIEAREKAQRELAAAKAQVEQVLAHSTAILDKFFDEAPMGLALLDQDRRYLRVNPSHIRSTGRSAEEYAGKRPSDLALMSPETIEAVEHVWATGRARTDIEIERFDQQGQPRAWLANYFPIDVGAGKPMIGAVIQDVTYQRQIEHQRREALTAAEEANRAKDQFLAKVSHELRSPLQVALSSAEVLKRMPDVPGAARKFIERLGHSVSMQARMIDDLLDLSRILSGKLHIAKEAVDPTLPLLRVLDQRAAGARERGVSIDAQAVRPGQAVVEADPARLEQICANLLENAIRFSPDGGRVVVAAITGGTHWRLVVRDFGVGLEPDELETIFRPFIQGSAQPRAGKGLGLGLAIVANLAESFGGRVWAESAGRGAGATFIVELPLAPEDSGPTSQKEEEREAPPDLAGLRVLYVEDESDVAGAMRDGLAELGARVHLATSYAQAIEALRAGDFDIVVTDLNLGDGPGGRELAQHVKAPIIGVSAFGTMEDQMLTKHAGFAAHLVKPVRVRTVALAVLAAAKRPRG